ncbi:Solute carrier family 22 member 17 [Liparis tanakae]|uniref:Solute carrier family 22 member 17 n=1 Tax=Liparis tanakae TaxID=230148 RepID=A0A4Z2GWB8_9TELE|nr:Solute carrier family 22 member 17 [Liparis tanakae]
MVMALGRKKQRVLIALSILPNLFLAFLLSSDPLITLSSPHHCHLPGPLPSAEVLNASLPWEKGLRPGDSGGLSQCKQYVNGSHSAVMDCEAGWDYNVTEGLRNNIVTEVELRPRIFLCTLIMVLARIPGLFPESPRWLLLSERSADMNSFTERRNSNRDVRDDESFTELDSEPAPSSRPHLSFPELVHSRNIWKNMCVLGFTSFIAHGISHCYSSFRGDVRGTAPSFYWTYLLSVCAGGGAWLLLWATVNRCGRRGILLLSMTMTGLASLILLGLMEYLSETAITVFSVLGLFSSQATASLCILFTAEIMPTVIR